MLHGSTQKLIIKLCEFTEAGHIVWAHGEGQTCIFETEGYVVEVQAQPPRLRLLHADGRELERAEEIDLASQAWPDREGTFASQISLLAARADRIARGAELAITRILSSLSAPPKTAPLGNVSHQSSSDSEPPPPAPHTAPGPPPNRIASDTAINRVLSVEPGPARAVEAAASEPAPEPVIIESEAAAVVADPEMVDEFVAAAAAQASEPPVDIRVPETPAAEPEPVLIEAETVAVVAEPAPLKPAPPATTGPGPEPVLKKEIPRPEETFGAIASFASPKKQPVVTAVPRASSPKPFSTSPLFFGVNQVPRERARAEPEPPPVPPPTAKPAPSSPPVAERKPEPAITGPDIYKPWS